MHITEIKLKELLLDSGMVDEELFRSMKEESARTGRELLDVLLGKGTMPEDYLVELLGSYFRAPAVNLKKETIPQETLETIPEPYAKAKNLVLFGFDKERGIAHVAMLDPFDFETIEFLRAKLGAWVVPHITAQSSLRYGLKQYKRKLGETFSQIIADNIEQSYALMNEPDLAKTAASIPITKILDSIIDSAVLMGASDIHFEPMEEELLVRYRVDGIMREILDFSPVIAPVLVARVKVLANLLIDEHSMPQDGRFKFDAEEGAVDIRVNIMPVFHGEKVEMRILQSSLRPLSLQELGLESRDTDIIREEISKSHGMVLVTGPTGHGKTTTLYAILHILNTPKVNITTIEDPIEYEVPRVNQTQVNVKAGVTFANGLRSLLRQNPDIIMIGEIRDNETVDIAVHAALTGHLVLSSLHTNDAPGALPRLLDMGAAPFLLASTVNVIVAQRLVRKICLLCVESYSLTPEISRLITAQIALSGNEDLKKREIPTRLFRGKGCDICNHSGYAGQIGIFEVMRVTPKISEMVLEMQPVAELRRQAIAEGMHTMFHDGMNKVEKGITTIEEALRVIRE